MNAVVVCVAIGLLLFAAVLAVGLAWAAKGSDEALAHEAERARRGMGGGP